MASPPLGPREAPPAFLRSHLIQQLFLFQTKRLRPAVEMANQGQGTDKAEQRTGPKSPGPSSDHRRPRQPPRPWRTWASGQRAKILLHACYPTKVSTRSFHFAMSTNPPIHLSISPPIHLSILPSIHSCDHPFIHHPSTHPPSIHPPIRPSLSLIHI